MREIICAILFLSFVGCTVPVQHTRFFVESKAVPRNKEQAIVAIRSYALANNYRDETSLVRQANQDLSRLQLPRRETSVALYRRAGFRPQELRVSVRGDKVIATVSENGYSDTPGALEERRRLYLALQRSSSAGWISGQEPYEHLVDIVPYAP